MTTQNLTAEAPSTQRFLRFLPLRALRLCGELVVFLLPAFNTGCAKTGEPHPPVVLLPESPTDLSAREYSDQILLTVSVPATNTNGSPVADFGSVEVWRRIEDRASSGVQLSEAEFFNGAEKIISIPGEKVAAFQKGKALALRDELLLADRSLVYARAFRYGVSFLNKKKQSAGLSNQAVVAPVPIPVAPVKPSSEVSQDFVRLAWVAPKENMDGSTPPLIAGYNVYRSEDPKSFPPAPLNQALVLKPEFEDRSFEFDKTVYYSVSVVGSREKPYAESAPSPALEVLPRDTFPPGAPQNLNAVEAGPAVLLLWAAPPDRDIAGYRVYRRQEGEDGARPLRDELIKEMSYRDETVQPGRKVAYRVTAVDTHGNEGPAAETGLEVR